MDRSNGRRVSSSHASSSSHYYPNMDLMRYVLAIAVIIAHINYLSGFRIPFPLSSYEAVGGFFAISGFLMYPNYTRHNNLLKYTRQRARRILPPYIFIVVFAAVGLSAVSILSPGEYFFSKGFLGYLGANISFLNWLHPDLPGVFSSDEYVTPAVNGSLWTMKVEWCLYFSVPLFILLQSKMRKIRRHWLALTVIALSIAYRLAFSALYYATGNEIYNILRRQIFGQLSFFYVGMLVYFLKDFFIRHRIFILALGIALRMLMPHVSSVCATILEPFAISFIVMSISLIPSDIKALRHRNNISYEMYLFHFPLIQLAIFLDITIYGVWITGIFVMSATVLLSLGAHLALERWVLRSHSLTSDK